MPSYALAAANGSNGIKYGALLLSVASNLILRINSASRNGTLDPAASTTPLTSHKLLNNGKLGYLVVSHMPKASSVLAITASQFQKRQARMEETERSLDNYLTPEMVSRDNFPSREVCQVYT